MKHRILVILLLIAGPLLSRGQLLQIVAGTTLTGAAGSSRYETISGNMQAGYSLGLSADFPLKKGGTCGLRSGLLLNRWNCSFPGSNGDKSGSLQFTYLQAPVFLAKRIGLSLFTDLLVGAGSYIAWRINTPSQIFTVTKQGNHIHGYLYPNDGSENNYYRELDYGLSFQCSVEMHNRFSICMQYDNGLQNVLRRTDATALHNRALTLSLRYYLNLPGFLHRQFPWKDVNLKNQYEL